MRVETQLADVCPEEAQSAEARPAQAQPQPASAGACLTRLETLAAELDDCGLRTRLVAPPGRQPSLHVVNPAASALAEDVYAGPGRDGEWWFWWSWAERIAASADLAAAVSRISHVLAARD